METSQHSIIDLLFTIALFAVFSITAICVVVMGAGVYKNTVDSMNRNYNTRTAAAYITEKVRQSDSKNSIELINLNGTDTIKLVEMLDETYFATYIYFADGYINELFLPLDAKPSLSDGEKILKAEGLDCSFTAGGVISVGIVDIDGMEHKLYITPRTKQSGGAVK